MAPEFGVWASLEDPVLIHICKQIVLAKWFEKGANVGALVWWDDCAVWQAVRGVWRWDWVILSREIAVLCVRAIAW